MDASRRNAYLKALSIEQWRLHRQPSVSEVQAASSAAVDSSPAESMAIAATEHAKDKQIARSQMDAVLAVDSGSQKAALVTSDMSRAKSDDKPVLIKNLSQLDLAQLTTEVTQCVACDLHKTRKQTVFGVGHEKATWMIIGEAPGTNEENEGEPFLAASVQLLNQMLRAIGLAREEVYIANVLKCRLPNNREPKKAELQSCPPYLQRQIELIQPKIILLLGRVAAQTVLQSDQPMAKLRAKVLYHPDFNIPMVASYHPAYLLRAPREKRKAWEDLQLARQQILSE